MLHPLLPLLPATLLLAAAHAPAAGVCILQKCPTQRDDSQEYIICRRRFVVLRSTAINYSSLEINQSIKSSDDVHRHALCVTRCHIRCHSMSSDVIRCHPVSSGVIRCRQMSSGVIRCRPMSSDVIRCHPMSSDVIQNNIR